MNTTFRRRMLASTLLFGASLIAMPALAQSGNTTSQTPTPGTADAATGTQQTSDIGDQAAPGQDIVVTGSRIASSTLTSPSPLQVIDAQNIQDSGATNLQSVLLQNPVFGTPGISRTNSNFSTSSAGVATVDLRNLGSNRTLVLVDGRRFVAGIPVPPRSTSTRSPPRSSSVPTC